MRPSEPEPVKLFVGLLYSDATSLERAEKLLVEAYGPVDYHSDPVPFDVTDYYKEEMGGPMWRIFLSFHELIDPGQLAEIKNRTNQIEDQLARGGKRTMNLDPGYMDVCKVVLASAKYNGQKIYIGEGIYADPTLHYEKGHFNVYPWSFPDFKTGRYEKIFLRIRELFKAARKAENLRR